MGVGWGERKRQRERGGLLISEGSFKYGGNMVETGLWAERWEDGTNGGVEPAGTETQKGFGHSGDQSNEWASLATAPWGQKSQNFWAWGASLVLKVIKLKLKTVSSQLCGLRQVPSPP